VSTDGRGSGAFEKDKKNDERVEDCSSFRCGRGGHLVFELDNGEKGHGGSKICYPTAAEEGVTFPKKWTGLSRGPRRSKWKIVIVTLPPESHAFRWFSIYAGSMI
jgi:hypothetical protein